MQLLPCSEFYSVDLYDLSLCYWHTVLILFCSSFEFWKYKSSNFVLFSPQDAVGYSRPYIAMQILGLFC